MIADSFEGEETGYFPLHRGGEGRVFCCKLLILYWVTRNKGVDMGRFTVHLCMFWTLLASNICADRVVWVVMV